MVQNIKKNQEISGVRNGGAVSVLYTFPLNGEAVIGYIIIPYSGMYPSKTYIQKRVRADTNCKTAVVVSVIDVDLILKFSGGRYGTEY